MIKTVMGIETSCDETAVAIYDAQRGLIANQVFSQKVHADYGGVVPELAARDHSTQLLPLVQQALQDAELDYCDLHGIAYTSGPGLMGALFVGAAFGRALAYTLKIPAIAVHHMEGHLLAPWLTESNITCPLVALLVSGGHTLLVYVEALGVYKILGETIDDAVGEVFDKTAKLLGLPYPGGPALAKLAEQGSPGRFQFTRPMLNRPGCDFSFSGLKTQVATHIKQQTLDHQTKADIAYAFEDTVTDTLLRKSQRAITQVACSRFMVAGGVSANQTLRRKLIEWGQSAGIHIIFPTLEFCTDNGAMIAYAGFLRLSAGQFEPLSIKARPRWPLTELTSIPNVEH